MKKNVLNWMAFLLMAVVSVGFVSCGSDDDEGGSGSSSGSTTVTINGKTYAVKKAFWYNEGDHYYLSFANYDIVKVAQTHDLSQMPNEINMLSIDYTATASGSGIPTGEFTDFSVNVTSVSKATALSGEDDMGTQYDADNGHDGNDTVLKIEKNGNNYKVSFGEMNYYPVKGNHSLVKGQAFSYSGSFTSMDGAFFVE